MSARRLMTPNPFTVRPETPLVEVVRLLLKHRISGLPVVDEAHRPVGVITEKDLLGLYAHDAAPKVAGDLMTPRPFAVSADAPLEDVVDVLMSRPFRRVLVVEGGKLVGVVSRRDVLPAILEVLEEVVR